MNNDTKTQDLPLALRTRNALLKAGLTTWGQVKSIELTNVEGLGARSIDAIQALWSEEEGLPRLVPMPEEAETPEETIARGQKRHEVTSMIDHAMRGGLDRMTGDVESLEERRHLDEVKAIHKRQFDAAAEKELSRSFAMAGTGSFGDPDAEIRRRGEAFRAQGGSVVAGDGRGLLALRLEADVQARVSALIPLIKALPHVKELGVDVSAEIVGRMALIRGLDALERAHGGSKSTSKTSENGENRATAPENADAPLPTGDEEVYDTPEGWTKVGLGETIPVPEAVLHDYYTQNGWVRYWGKANDQVIYFYWSPERRLQDLKPFPGTDKSGRSVAVQETPWGPGHVVPSRWANS
jgi:hypothetical protein